MKSDGTVAYPGTVEEVMDMRLSAYGFEKDKDHESAVITMEKMYKGVLSNVAAGAANSKELAEAALGLLEDADERLAEKREKNR